MACTKTPPDQKWVINERAVVAGEVRAIETAIVRLAARKRQLCKLLAHLDNVYGQLAPELPPVPVLVVNAHQRYGGRGNCIGWVRDTLRAAYPQTVATTALAEAAVKTFELQFRDTAQRERFRDNSIRTALRKLLTQGEAERLHDFTGIRCRTGVWRWKPPEASFAEVAAQARAMEQD